MAQLGSVALGQEDRFGHGAAGLDRERERERSAIAELEHGQDEPQRHRDEPEPNEALSPRPGGHQQGADGEQAGVGTGQVEKRNACGHDPQRGGGWVASRPPGSPRPGRGSSRSPCRRRRWPGRSSRPGRRRRARHRSASPAARLQRPAAPRPTTEPPVARVQGPARAAPGAGAGGAERCCRAGPARPGSTRTRRVPGRCGRSG